MWWLWFSELIRVSRVGKRNEVWLQHRLKRDKSGIWKKRVRIRAANVEGRLKQIDAAFVHSRRAAYWVWVVNHASARWMEDEETILMEIRRGQARLVKGEVVLASMPGSHDTRHQVKP